LYTNALDRSVCYLETAEPWRFCGGVVVVVIVIIGRERIVVSFLV